jgi:hypothetical protein
MSFDVKTMKEELVLEGAKARLTRIQEELTALFREFPSLFPSGQPVVQPLLRRKVSDRQAEAEKLIAGAEKIRRSKPAKRAKAKLVPTPVPPEQSSDPSGLTVTVAEAGRILGLTDSAVRIRVKDGKLKAHGIGPAGKQCLLRADVEAQPGNLQHDWRQHRTKTKEVA